MKIKEETKITITLSKEEAYNLKTEIRDMQTKITDEYVASWLPTLNDIKHALENMEDLEC